MSNETIHDINIVIKSTSTDDTPDKVTNNAVKQLALASKKLSPKEVPKNTTQATAAEGGATGNTGTTATSAPTPGNTTPSATAGTPGTTSAGGGANGGTQTGANAASAAPTSNTPPVSEATTKNTTPAEGGAAKGITIASTTPSDSGGPNSSTTTQTYAGVAGQQTINVPAAQQTAATAPSLEAVKKAVAEKLKAATSELDKGYWNEVLTKLESIAPTDLIKDEKYTRFNTEVYEVLKKRVTTEKSFNNCNWETVRGEMITRIKEHIIKGEKDESITKYWGAIAAKLGNDDVNVSNLFEQHDELFLLLRDVIGVALPDKITINHGTKAYPNLSVDKVYAKIGKDEVYTYLKKQLGNRINGKAIQKGKVVIKDSKETMFLIDKTLSFIANMPKNDNLSWVVYKTKEDFEVFENEGLEFSYHFEKEGNYVVEAFGTTKNYKGKKSAYVKVAIKESPEIKEIIVDNTIANRPSEEEKVFTVLPENIENKPFSEAYLKTIVWTATNSITKKVQTATEASKASFVLNEIGTYTIEVTAKNRKKPLEKTITFANNYVSKILPDNKKKIYFLEDIENCTVSFTANKFKMAATEEEKENVKWLVYRNGKQIPLEGFTIAHENDDTKKPYLAKGQTFSFSIPKKEGAYFIEAYSNSFDGTSSKSGYALQVVVPEVTKACWADSAGAVKTTSGLKGEEAYVKAHIKHYSNQPLGIHFFVNGKQLTKTPFSTKTDKDGNVNYKLILNDQFKKYLKLGSEVDCTELQFKLIGRTYDFKKNKLKKEDTLLTISTKREIIDAYFVYNNKRVTKTDTVPYGAKVTAVVQTTNMKGKTVTVNVYRNTLGPDTILNAGEALVNAEGIAKREFVLKIKWSQMDPFGKDIFYVGSEEVNGINWIISDEKFENNGLKAVEEGAASIASTQGIDENDPQLIWGAKVSKEFRQKVVKISKELWGDKKKFKMANELMVCMALETGRKFTSNVGYPKATGLIQFTGTAITAMNKNGYNKGKKITKDILKNMTEVEQLDYVKLYFEMWMKKMGKTINDVSDMYMTIFAPKAVGKKDDFILYDKGKNYQANKSADGQYYDKENNSIKSGTADGKITKGEMSPRLKKLAWEGEKYRIGIDEKRKLNQILAEKILSEGNITFSNSHVSGVIDRANAINNINDAKKGNKAETSNYGNAPGVKIELASEILYVLYHLSKEYKMNISEISGASHSKKSSHYKGKAIDINYLNGKHIGKKNKPAYSKKFHEKFRLKAKKLGASLILDPYNESKGHYHHIHIQVK